MERQGDSPESAELLSFLIADIRGYTAFTQVHGDEAAAALTGKFAQVAREGIEANGGRLLELRGDEALAVFTSARASLRAAVVLQEVFTDETRLEPGLPLTVGIGLDAGEVVPVEGGYRGGALNLAARLCSLAKAGEALASESLTHLAGAVEGVTVTEWGTAEVKGLSERVRAFALSGSDGTGPVPDFVASRAVPPRLDSAVPIIGRDAELRRLSWAWRTARRGSGTVAVVRGPSGIGKTRLLSEVADLVVHGGGEVRFFSPADDEPDLEGLRKALTAPDGPVLVAIDDADAGAEAVLEVLSEVGSVSARPVLVLVALDEEHASDDEVRAVRRRLDSALDVPLRPLDAESMRRVAALYLDSVAELPAGLLEATGGVPRRLHQAVAGWAEDRATSRLGLLASQAAGSRSEVAVVESQLAGTVADLQQVRERARLYGLGSGRHGPEPERSPYKGLDSFGPEDADAFFGRERLVADLVARVAGGGLVGVVGPSGSGKSSLVRAGLIPAVTAGVLPGSQDWVTVVVRPGEHPVRALDVALLPLLPPTVAATLTGQDPLLAQLAQLAQLDVAQVPDIPHVLVVVDQAEELFTVCTDQAERAGFVAGLVAAADDPAGRIDVVLTVRADYYGRFAGDQRLASAIAANQVLVGPMTSEEYRRAITRPAQRHGVSVEPDLVDALVDEVAGQSGALPLLSTALVELWDARTDRTMTLASYRATGGLQAAVARLAESVYTGLDADQRQAARRIFLRLTGPGVGDTVVKRRVRLADLVTDEPASALVDLLARRRLLTIDDGSVEVAHEALFREWPRFTTWLEEDREGIRLRAHLADAAANWEAVGRDHGELYRGARLSATLDWTTAHAQDLNPVEQEFVTASSTEAQRATAHQQRQNRRLRGLLAGAAVFLALAVIAGLLAVRQANRADDKAAEARTAALSADARRVGVRAQLLDDISLSLLLAAAGARLWDSPETQVNLLTMLTEHPTLVRSATPGGGYLEAMDVSPDGRWIAASDDKNRMHLYDAATDQLVRSYDADPTPDDVPGYIEPAFSPDSKRLAVVLTVGSSDPVRLLDPETMQPAATLAFPGDEPVWGIDVGYSADGRHLAATVLTANHLEQDPEQIKSFAAVWDLRSPAEPPAKVPTGVGLQGVELSPDGRTLYAGHPLTAYDVATGRRLWRRNDVSATLDLDVNVQGTLLAAGATGKGALLVDAATGRTTARLRGHRDGVRDMRFSPDGTRVGSVSSDGELIVWDAATGRLLERWDTFDPWGVGFSPDGDRVHGGGGDSMLRTWDLAMEETYLRSMAPVGLDGVITHAIISPDGQRVAYSWLDKGTGWVKFVDTATGAATPPTRVPVFSEFPWPNGAWHPLGERYVTSCDFDCAGNGTATILDPATGRLLGQRKISDGDLWSVAYVDGGRSLLVGDSEGRRSLLVDPETLRPRGAAFDVPIWCCATPIGGSSTAMVFDSTDGTTAQWRVIDVGTGEVRTEGELDMAPIASVAAPDGSRVVVGGNTRELVAIDVDTGDQRSGSTGVDSDVRWLRYSDDGERLVSGAADGTVSLWDGRTLELLGTVQTPYDGKALPAGAEFIGDSHDVVIAAYDGRVYRWDTEVDRAIDFACQMAGRNLTEEEWAEFLPAQPYREVCPEL